MTRNIVIRQPTEEDRVDCSGLFKRKPSQGRPRGSQSTCSACGQLGHNARNGKCSAGHIGASLMEASGMSQSDSARRVGVSDQAISQRRRRMQRGEP